MSITKRKTPSLLIVEDDVPLRETLVGVLRRRQYRVQEAGSVAAAHLMLKKNVFDLVLLDLTLPDGSGLDILQKISVKYRNRIIIVSGTGTIDVAVEAMRRGAFDFLEKPVDRDVLLVTIKKVINLNKELDDYRRLKEELSEGPSFKNIVYKSSAMADVVKKARESARCDKTVLITGETGTGKELIASAIHRASNRNKKPFITVNCASIPVNLAESELFGFEKGAFTGADDSYPGKFLLANSGTIFLDEIGELHPEIQPKLLRVLESGEITSLKSRRSQKLDIRVIAATNKTMIGHDKNCDFRNDLYYRIEEIIIHLPALRERKTDIMELTRHFISMGNITYSKQVTGLDPEAVKLINGYSWPGNVRELKNTIDEIVAFIQEPLIKPRHLPPKLRDPKIAAKVDESLLTLEDLEKEHVKKVLRITGHNIQRSARILNIGRPALYRKIKKYNLEEEGK
jgi:two-component system, NtrC family, response regulator AtoC